MSTLVDAERLNFLYKYREELTTAQRKQVWAGLAAYVRRDIVCPTSKDILEARKLVFKDPVVAQRF